MEENEVKISSELLNNDYDDIENQIQVEFDDDGIDEGFASQIGF